MQKITELKQEDNLDKEIKDIESEILKRTKQLTDVTKQSAIRKLKNKIGSDIDYIG